MQSFPLLYTRAAAVIARPTVCPQSAAPAGCVRNIGPDVADGGPGGGTVWGGIYRPGTWRKAASGYYVLMEGHQPQHVARLQVHPRITRWLAVPGADPEHYWRVPVLLAPLRKSPTGGQVYVSALDRVFNGTTYAAPADLNAIQQRLFCLAEGVPLADTADKRDGACCALAIDLLQLGQEGDAEFFGLMGWITEQVVQRVLIAACGVTDEVEPPEVSDV